MNRRTILRIVSVVTVLVASSFAWAQHNHVAAGAEEKSAPIVNQCKMMSAQTAKMSEMMKKMDQQLDDKVQVMNKATGDSKMTAMADVINELVSQRKQRHTDMMGMHQKMMSHMAQHMQMGMSDQQKNAMKDCPMMKAMMHNGEDAGEHVDKADSQNAPKHDHQH